jgi:transposase
VAAGDLPKVSTWRTVHGDLTDAEWNLIADLVQGWWRPGGIGRPSTVDRRRVVDAILYVTATGCQWRALPAEYPNWNTVHRLHLQWSKNGTWEKIADRLRQMIRKQHDRDSDPSATVIDARTARGAATVTSTTRGYDAGKKISGRKTFGVVDTLGLLLAVVVVAANTSDNAGGIEVINRAQRKTDRLVKVWHDAGFKSTFRRHCAAHHISAEEVSRKNRHTFVVLPKRWLVERTWSWTMNNRRLQLDYERDPRVTEGFVWAAHSRLMLRQLAPT